jgi:hypothetical protein
MQKTDVAYPGHPIVIAHFIVSLYESLESACQRGKYHAAALEDIRVPGGGLNVALAIDMLAHIIRGIQTIDAAFEWADNAWKGECSSWRSDGVSVFRDKFEPGQKQANKIKPLLVKKLKTWK